MSSSTHPRGDEPQWWEHLLDGTDPPGAELSKDGQTESDDLPEEFTPPEPPPLPVPSPPVVIGVLSVFGGLGLLVWPSGLAHWLGVSTTLVLLLGTAVLFAGGLTLLYRLRPGDEEEELGPPDDGAVV